LLKITLIIFILLTIFIGCSTKQYFEPKNISGSYNENKKDILSEIKTFNIDGATLKNYKFITFEGVSKNILPNGYKFLNKVDGKILASNKKGNLLIDTKNNILFFKQNIISASIRDNLLALVFEDNSFAIYDLENKKFKFKEYNKMSFVNNIKIANPIFLDDIVLFPSLDGKLIIANSITFKLIKTINIDPNNQINNVIYLTTIGDTMIVATSNKILTLGNGAFAIKSYAINNVVSDNKYIYISTIEGDLIKLNFSLDKLASKKFKFAKFHTLGIGKSLYALESQGYLIKIDKNFKSTIVYDFTFDNLLKVIAIDNMLYFNNLSIKLK
jgi:hypothetical protein